MLNPELPGVGIETGQREITVHFGVREKCGIKVQAEFGFLGPVQPAAEFVDGVGIPVDLLAILFGITGVKIQLGSAGNHGAGKIDVGPQLLGIAGAAGIVAGGGNATGQGADAVKADNVVPLPAVHGYGNGISLFHGGVYIHAHGGVLCFGIFVTFENQCFVHHTQLLFLVRVLSTAELEHLPQ